MVKAMFCHFAVMITSPVNQIKDEYYYEATVMEMISCPTIGANHQQLKP